jgi:hypothetical protein
MDSMQDIAAEVAAELERVASLPLPERAAALEALQARLRAALDDPASA